jgi:TolB-like protein/DNA-binding winged helix-turn-helix (wHTH) protein
MRETGSFRGAVRFGSFEVDLRACELRKHGIRLKLQDQPFHLLQILLEHHGELVSREELQRQIWTADTYVDFEKGLNNAVKKLRDALGDSAEKPRFIETHARHGYRFIGTIATTNGASLTPRITSTRGALLTARSLPLFRWVALGTALFVALVALVFGLDIGSVREHWLVSASSPVIHSLAVLPLANLSSETNQEYFSDGMTDALITDLAQIGSLKVISRTSSMQYKQSKKSLPEIARELNVDGIVEGTVQRSGDRVRITAQLIQGSTDRHIWANSYDRELKDALQLEGEVAFDIAEGISSTLPSFSVQKASSVVYPLKVDAYDDYLKGRSYVRRHSGEDVVKGAELLGRSIERDPNYAPTYAELSFAYQAMALFNRYPPKEVIPKAKAAAMKALSLNDGLSDAHLVLGMIYGEYEWNWEAQGREYRRALQLDPNSSRAHLNYASYLLLMGRKDEAIREIDTATRLDPFSPTQLVGASWMHMGLRDYDSAIREGRRAAEIDPSYANAHVTLAAALGAKGASEESFREWLRYLSLNGDEQLAQRLEDAAGKLTSAGDPGKKLAHISLAYYQAKAKKRYVAAMNFAEAYLDLGDKERALDWLEKAYEDHSTGLYEIQYQPGCDQLRSEPRFQELLRRMNLPVKSASTNPRPN